MHRWGACIWRRASVVFLPCALKPCVMLTTRLLDWNFKLRHDGISRDHPRACTCGGENGESLGGRLRWPASEKSNSTMGRENSTQVGGWRLAVDNGISYRSSQSICRVDRSWGRAEKPEARAHLRISTDLPLMHPRPAIRRFACRAGLSDRMILLERPCTAIPPCPRPWMLMLMLCCLVLCCVVGV
jgi:hypothetical protein